MGEKGEKAAKLHRVVVQRSSINFTTVSAPSSTANESSKKNSISLAGTSINVPATSTVKQKQNVHEHHENPSHECIFLCARPSRDSHECIFLMCTTITRILRTNVYFLCARPSRESFSRKYISYVHDHQYYLCARPSRIVWENALRILLSFIIAAAPMVSTCMSQVSPKK